MTNPRLFQTIFTFNFACSSPDDTQDLIRKFRAGISPAMDGFDFLIAGISEPVELKPAPNPGDGGDLGIERSIDNLRQDVADL